jgi:hypothetical protein
MDYYILIRNDLFQIVCCLPGSDPLYGRGSWSIFNGPYETWEEAEDYLSVGGLL